MHLILRGKLKHLFLINSNQIIKDVNVFESTIKLAENFGIWFFTGPDVVTLPIEDEEKKLTLNLSTNINGNLLNNMFNNTFNASDEFNNYDQEQNNNFVYNNCIFNENNSTIYHMEYKGYKQRYYSNNYFIFYLSILVFYC
jgi:hypothetical protein